MSLDGGAWVCSVEQLADSLGGYLQSGEADPAEVILLTRAAFWLKYANAELLWAGGGSQHAAISLAASMAARGARTTASARQSPGAP